MLKKEKRIISDPQVECFLGALSNITAPTITTIPARIPIAPINPNPNYNMPIPDPSIPGHVRNPA
jgi:hypothetical protein